MTEYYRKYAPKLFENGYEPIPVLKKRKTPVDTGWQNMPITSEQVKTWAENGRADFSVGIRNTCALDLDIRDKKVSHQMVEFIREMLDRKDFPIRIGKYPKLLIPSSPKSAYNKKTQIKWYAPDGVKHEIEFLAPHSQQFVAYGIHEKTNKDYSWNNKPCLLSVHIDDLPVFDEYDLDMLEDEFNRLAKENGWVKKKPGKAKKKTKPETTEPAMHPLIEYKQPGQGNIKELQGLLAKLPIEYCDEREEWVKIGSILHFETAGSADGFEMFHSWSQESDQYKNKKDVKDRWKSFSLDKSGDNCATIGSLYQILIDENLMDDTRGYEEQIKTAADREALRKIMGDIKKDKTLDALSRTDLANEIHVKVVKGFRGNWKKTDILKKITPAKPKKESIDTEDPWLQGWMFLANQNKFGRSGDDQMTPRASFNGMYNRFLVDREDLENKHKEADRYALEVRKVEYMHDLMYLPSAGETFDFDGKKMLNSFDPNSLGERKPKEKWTEQDHAAVHLFESHVKEMFNLDGEADLLFNTMAFIVQNPGKRLLWSLTLYGCEGDGKTTICKVLARGIGTVNAGIVNGSDIVSSVFSDWAVGNLVKIVEELKVPGKNRFDTIEKIKTFITNDVISINPKYQVPKKVPNTASIITTTNHRDAIPYQSGSRRFAVIGSKWTDKRQILAKHGVDYFIKMIQVFERHETALNEYLATRKVPASFDPYQLPVTQTLLSGIENEKSELMVIIEDLIQDDSLPTAGEKVILLKDLRNKIEYLVDSSTDCELETMPSLSEIKRTLRKLKYQQSRKQYNVFGGGTKVWLKDIAESRQNILSEIENSKLIKNDKKSDKWEDVF